MSVKEYIKNFLNGNNIGRELFFRYKKITGKIPEPDMDFPELINLETASACNLSCVHCPPHMKKFRHMTRKFGIMEIRLFERLMDEIDEHGKRRIALHKDGEPLLHPEIIRILKRVKKNVKHEVYLTTNAHKLDKKISEAILENQIDILNFSLGAATRPFYEKVRGNNFDSVINNVLNFLKIRENYETKPRVIVQIIDLPQFPEMKEEIGAFKNFWKNYDVEIQIWENLTWSVFDYGKYRKLKRYPCYSLWESLVVNSDGLVSACCMDWKQQLLTGDANKQSLSEIWKGNALRRIRNLHVENRIDELPLCPTCNYWAWQPRLEKYPL